MKVFYTYEGVGTPSPILSSNNTTTNIAYDGLGFDYGRNSIWTHGHEFGYAGDILTSHKEYNNENTSLYYIDNICINKNNLISYTYTDIVGLRKYISDTTYGEIFNDYTHNLVGNYSHAEGYSTYANADYSHAEGYQTQAKGIASHSEGYNTYANGNYSHSGGCFTYAYTDGSFIHGNHLNTYSSDYEAAFGSYNESTSGTNQLFSIGNGTASNPKNVFAVHTTYTYVANTLQISNNSSQAAITASNSNTVCTNINADKLDSSHKGNGLNEIQMYIQGPTFKSSNSSISTQLTFNGTSWGSTSWMYNWYYEIGTDKKSLGSRINTVGTGDSNISSTGSANSLEIWAFNVIRWLAWNNKTSSNVVKQGNYKVNVQPDSEAILNVNFCSCSVNTTSKIPEKCWATIYVWNDTNVYKCGFNNYTWYWTSGTYATGNDSGTGVKGILSVNTTTITGITSDTQLGLSISNGVIQLIRVLDPKITISGSNILAANSSSCTFKISSNNYTRVTSSKASPINVTLQYTGQKTGSETLDILPNTSTDKTISFTAPNTATSLTVTLSKTTSSDLGTASGSCTITFYWPIYTASTNSATSGTEIGWTDNTTLKEINKAATYQYVFIYSGAAGSSNVIKYSWNSSANTTASPINSVTAYGKTYNVFDLGKTNATIISIA